MAKEEKTKENKNSGERNKKKGPEKEEKKFAKLIRILSTDIEGDMSVYAGLKKIKGVSWTISNGVCKMLGIEKSKDIQELSKEELDKIAVFLKNPILPSFILNRRKDFDSGEDKHLIGADLDLRKDFDIKRLKKIKSYKGIRHSAGLPVRGQRTRSNFRKNRAIGVGRKNKAEKKE